MQVLHTFPYYIQVMKDREKEVTDDEAEEDEETDKKDDDAEAVSLCTF